jgi:hypothetical protein
MYNHLQRSGGAQHFEGPPAEAGVMPRSSQAMIDAHVSNIYQGSQLVCVHWNF